MWKLLLPLVQDFCCVAAGVALQRLRVLNDADGDRSAGKQLYGNGGKGEAGGYREGRLTPLSFAACGYGALFGFTCQVISWMWFRKAYERQRAVLMGCAVGSSLLLWSFPLVETVFGVVGLQSVIFFQVANILAGVVSYLNFASAGPAFPASYVHQDGTIYQGQWNGLNKEGVGAYKYKSGAAYEGEWKDNQKSGRGVYYFPTGGLYEGEWLDGNRNGVGIRTFNDGRMQAGRWLENKLISSLDVWQCTDAVIGATQAARAAREVNVGGGKLMDALQDVIRQPVLWATAAAIAVNLLNRDLSPTIQVMTRTLASIHRPLALMTAGLTIPFAMSRRNHVFSSLLVAGNRVVLALSTSSAACLGCYYYFPDLAPFALPLLLASLAPVSLQATSNARAFRLNEELTATIVSTSSVVSAASMFGIAAVMTIARPAVAHSSLCLSFSRMGLIAAATVLSVLVVTAMRVRPAAKKRLVLRRSEVPGASELDTAGLDEMLQYVDVSDSESASPSASDEKRSPPPAQAICRHRARRPLASRLRRHVVSSRPATLRGVQRIARNRVSLSRLNGPIF